MNDTKFQFTDEEMLDYAYFHSQTERALFSPEQRKQLVRIIYGDEAAEGRQYGWRSLHYSQIKDELERGWERLKEKRAQAAPSPGKENA